MEQRTVESVAEMEAIARTERLRGLYAMWLFPSRILFTRIVLGLTVLLSLLLPALEYFCTWDSFVFGGEDIEFSLLCILVLLGMMTRVIDHSASVRWFVRRLFCSIRASSALLLSRVGLSLVSCMSEMPLAKSACASLSAPIPLRI